MAQPKIIGDQIDQSTLDVNSILPSQTGNDGYFLTTNGSAASWSAVPGALNVFNYKADTSSTSAPPPSEKIRWNNATQASATSLFINDVTANGYNINDLLAVLVAGNRIIFQKINTPTIFQEWTITTVTDNTTYWTFGVTLTDSGGGNFGINDNMAVGIIRSSGGGGSGTVTSVGMSVPSFLSVAGSPITTSGTLAVSLSGTALPAANGGTAQTTYATGDILYASATNTISKLPVGTTGQLLNVVAGAPAWASPFPIGTILTAPTAPTVGGTWLECNGTGVSQATYSALYASIGHSWCNYEQQIGSTSPIAANSTNIIIWSGTRWVAIQGGSTQTHHSTDGITWTAGGLLPAAVAIANAVAGNSGEIIVHTSGATTISYGTTDSGSTWTTNTAFPTSAISRLQFNGTRWLLVVSTGTTVWEATNPIGGGAWTARTSVLPSAAGTAPGVVWDGTYWVINAGGVTMSTTVNDASSGWATRTNIGNTIYNIGTGADAATNRSGIMLRRGNTTTNSVVRSTNGFTTASRTGLALDVTWGAPATNPTVFTWNGFAFIAFSPLGSDLFASVDGDSWNRVSTRAGVVSSTTSVGIGSQIGPSGPGQTSSVSFANGKMPYVLPGPIIAVLKPVTDLTVNFCLPTKQGVGKQWIRAL